MFFGNNHYLFSVAAEREHVYTARWPNTSTLLVLQDFYHHNELSQSEEEIWSSYQLYGISFTIESRKKIAATNG
jgi:hypothetical protein